jgi:hypothetical protein
VAHIGKMRNAYKFLVRESEEKRPLGNHRGRWKDNIKTNLKERGWESVN